jgi:ribulose-5-phosphate 4-epimerase/fuculose-1-phosphate aldolase
MTEREDAARAASSELVAAGEATDEATLRRDLAAAFRLAAQHGWHDQLATHMSARLPGPEPRFLINPYGLFFEEVTASSLVVVDLDGRLLTPSPYGINRAGFIIHSAIHRAREDAQCVIHLHTIAGSAVAAQPDGLLPISPGAMYFHGRLGYHDWEGVTIAPEEQGRIVAHLAEHMGLIFRNHGTLTVGRTVGEAFERMYVLEKACQIQVAALAGGARPVVPPRDTIESVYPQLSSFGDIAGITWRALLRRLERTAPGYRD